MSTRRPFPIRSKPLPDMVCSHCQATSDTNDEGPKVGDVCPLCDDGVFVAVKDAERMWQGG